jgi:hypothetical protein
MAALLVQKYEGAYVSFILCPRRVISFRDRRIIFIGNMALEYFWIENTPIFFAKKRGKAKMDVGWSQRRWLFAGICGKI